MRDELRAYARDSNELMDDEAESIKLWVDTNSEKVLMYRPGVETEEGVPEEVCFGLGPQVRAWTTVVQAPRCLSPLTQPASRPRSTTRGLHLAGRTRLGATNSSASATNKR